MADDRVLTIDGREVVVTDHLYVRCDGGDGALGHPIEYLTLEKGGEAMCGYCGRRFVHQDAPGAGEISARSAA